MGCLVRQVYQVGMGWLVHLVPKGHLARARGALVHLAKGGFLEHGVFKA